MLLELINNLKTNWKTSLSKQKDEPYFIQLNQHVTNAYADNEVFPAAQNIFRAFDFFDIEQTKVVILGQDPYHGPTQANGLAFGINDNCLKTPPSLKNIAKELQNDTQTILQDFSLVSWARQQVLLLNSNLTVQAHLPLSHETFGWQKLVMTQLHELLKIKPDVVFVCWGRHAQNLVAPLKAQYVISSAHPSPFSAFKFFGSKPFTQVNECLKRTNQEPIVW